MRAARCVAQLIPPLPRDESSTRSDCSSAIRPRTSRASSTTARTASSARAVEGLRRRGPRQALFAKFKKCGDLLRTSGRPARSSSSSLPSSLILYHHRKEHTNMKTAVVYWAARAIRRPWRRLWPSVTRRGRGLFCSRPDKENFLAGDLNAYDAIAFGCPAMGSEVLEKWNSSRCSTRAKAASAASAGAVRLLRLGRRRVDAQLGEGLRRRGGLNLVCERHLLRRARRCGARGLPRARQDAGEVRKRQWTARCAIPASQAAGPYADCGRSAASCHRRIGRIKPTEHAGRGKKIPSGIAPRRYFFAV